MTDSIRTRLTVLFISLATVPLLLLAAILAWNSFSVHSSRALALERAAAQRAAGQIASFTKELERDLRQLAYIEGLEGMTPQMQRSALLRLQSFRDIFTEIAWLDSQGRQRVRVSQAEVVAPADLQDRSQTMEFIAPLTSGRTYYGDVTFDEATGEPFMTIAVPTFDLGTGEIGGVLVGNVRLKEAWDAIANVRVGTQGVQYILDDGGRVVGHRNPSVVLRGTTFSIPEGDGIQRGLGGGLAVIAAEPVSLSGRELYVVTEWPVTEAFAPTARTLTIVSVILLVSLAAAVSLGVTMVRRIVQPIETLAQHARAMTAGDLSQTAEVKGRDELAALASAFNTMAAQVRNMVSTLEQRVTERTREVSRVNEHLQHEVVERRHAEEALRQEARVTETVHRIGASLVSELDLETVVQSITDATTRLTGAEFGAFFYNVLDDRGESYMLYTLSGAPREAFDRFPQPRNTPLFGPTFRGQGPVRLDDVTQDSRYAKNPPHHGMPEGHLPVRSYLAVPVVSRSGDVLGGLFFGHPKPGRFTERHQRIAVGIAAWAAVAIDNARLYQQSRLAEQALRVEVTERTRIAERLRLYGEIIANSNDGVAIIDKQGYYIEQNAAHRQMLGYSDEELEGRTPAIHMGDATFSMVAQALAETGQFRGELVCRTRSGRQIDIELSAFALRDDRGEVTCYVGIKRDITERKQAEKELRRREAELKALVENNPDHVTRFDRELRYVYVNPALEHTVGIRASELVGRRVPDVFTDLRVPPHRIAFWADSIQQVFETGRESTVEYERHSPDGPRYVQSRLVPEFGPDGSVQHVLAIGRDITPLRRVEEELRRRERELQTLLENNPDIVARFDSELRCLYVNPAFESLTGRSADEYIGRTLAEAGAGPERAQVWERPMRYVLETGEERTVDFETGGKNGVTYYQLRLVPEFDDQVQVRTVLAIARDMTDRVLAENQVRASEERARRLAAENETVAEIGRVVASSLEIGEVYKPFAGQVRKLLPFDRIAINLIEPNGEYAVKAFAEGIPVPGWEHGMRYELRGSVEEVAMRAEHGVLVTGERVNELLSQYERTMSPGVNAGLRSFLIVPLRSERRAVATLWISSCTAHAYTEADLALAQRIGGQIAGAVANAQLYADLKRIQAQIEVRARQQSVVSRLGQRALTDRDLDALLQEATELVAHTLDVEYCKVLELLPGGKLLLLRAGVGWKPSLVGSATVGTERTSQAGYALLTSGPVIVEDLRTETRFSDPRLLAEHGVVSGMSVIIHGPEGPYGVLGTHTTRRRAFTQDDIHFIQSVANIIAAAVERKWFEESLHSHVEELARSNAELEQFAYVASHDLQEPLRAIAGFTRMLARRYHGQLDDTADDFMTRTINAANRMQELIQDLLQYSRVGRNVPSPATVNTGDIVRQELENLEAAMAVTGATVTCDPLPVVTADAYMLTQVFRNLISNGIKFHGQEPPRVHISATARGREWVFSVKDNGIGIEPRYFERIFVIFQRLHSREEYEGTGIGLAICRKAIERLGGRIWVESQSGRGSTFYFTLPIAPSETPPAEEYSSDDGTAKDGPDIRVKQQRNGGVPHSESADGRAHRPM